MTKQFQILQRRFGNARPGLQLIAVEDAAIPVTVVRADVLVQEKKELPITEEFTLRFVGLGVDIPEEIAAYLGLDQAHVLDASAAQLIENHLRRKNTGGRLALTPLGAEVVRNLAATQPVLRQLPIAFDRLTWTLADYPQRSLIEKKDAQERGMTILPAARNARIGLDDVTPSGFNALMKGDRFQVLRIHKVAVKKHRYLPVSLLVYGDQSRRELELAVCIEDDLATDHGLALDGIEAVKRLGLSLGEAEPRPVLDEELENQRRTDSPAESAEDADHGGQVPASSGVTSPVRSVSVFEHADLLAEALSTAKYRLLIIAPWVRDAVVSTDFVANLEQRLRTGVEVTIAHGYGPTDKGSDESALNRLSNLAARYDKFTFVRVKNTHAKILIFDEIWVSTSFNWLSFRGDSERTYRMEEGTLVNIPARVDKEYTRYLVLIDEQRIS
jgi:phosphatidylserine/phosphatidylglycerophosphate/cardiolipin synthase-like enzyme